MRPRGQKTDHLFIIHLSSIPSGTGWNRLNFGFTLIPSEHRTPFSDRRTFPRPRRTTVRRELGPHPRTKFLVQNHLRWENVPVCWIKTGDISTKFSGRSLKEWFNSSEWRNERNLLSLMVQRSFRRRRRLDLTPLLLLILLNKVSTAALRDPPAAALTTMAAMKAMKATMKRLCWPHEVSPGSEKSLLKSHFSMVSEGSAETCEWAASQS